MSDMEVEQAELNGQHVWIVSARMPFTIASWTALTRTVPRRATCIHSENDGKYAWSVWTAPIDNADMATLDRDDCWCCDAGRGDTDWHALLSQRVQPDGSPAGQAPYQEQGPLGAELDGRVGRTGRA